MITNEQSILLLVMSFLVGCIPLICCILMNLIAEWDVNRKRNKKW
jgi:hypothetical protein